jgi:cardiolipin-specific phospholipase
MFSVNDHVILYFYFSHQCLFNLFLYFLYLVCSAFIGPERVKEILIRRFRDRWNEEETTLLADYLYHITAANPSGEYAMNGLLTPMIDSKGTIGLYARRPLVHRMSKETLDNIPIHIVYGDNDWLYTSPGCQDAINVLKNNGLTIEMEIMENAGHHVYMDNSNGLHESMNSFFLKHAKRLNQF